MAIIVVFFFTACGGGASDSSTASTQPVLTDSVEFSAKSYQAFEAAVLDVTNLSLDDENYSVTFDGSIEGSLVRIDSETLAFLTPTLEAGSHNVEVSINDYTTTLTFELEESEAIESPKEYINDIIDTVISSLHELTSRLEGDKATYLNNLIQDLETEKASLETLSQKELEQIALFIKLNTPSEVSLPQSRGIVSDCVEPAARAFATKKVFKAVVVGVTFAIIAPEAIFSKVGAIIGVATVALMVYDVREAVEEVQDTCWNLTSVVFDDIVNSRALHSSASVKTLLLSSGSTPVFQNEVTSTFSMQSTYEIEEANAVSTIHELKDLLSQINRKVLDFLPDNFSSFVNDLTVLKTETEPSSTLYITNITPSSISNTMSVNNDSFNVTFSTTSTDALPIDFQITLKDTQYPNFSQVFNATLSSSLACPGEVEEDICTVTTTNIIDAIEYRSISSYLMPYENNILHGTSYYYKNDILESETPYQNGLMEGIQKIYYESSVLKLEIPYVNAIKEGFEKFYNTNGTLYSKTPYVNGVAEGIQITYYESGSIKYEMPHVNGVAEGITKEYTEDGFLEHETPKVNGIIHGTQRGYYQSGILNFTLPFVNGLKDGILLWYHPNGNLGNRDPWVNNVRHGTRYYYDTSGILVGTQVYSNGVGQDYVPSE